MTKVFIHIFDTVVIKKGPCGPFLLFNLILDIKQNVGLLKLPEPYLGSQQRYQEMTLY